LIKRYESIEAFIIEEMGEMNKSVFGIIDSSQTVSSEQGTHLTTSY